MKHAALTLLFALAVAACSSEVRPAPEALEPSVVQLDPKSATTASVDVGDVDVIGMVCERELCSFELFVRGDVVANDAISEISLAVGSFEQIRALRDTVVADKPVVHPDGMLVLTQISRGIEDWGRAFAVEVGRGEHHAILHGGEQRLAGKVEVDLRHAPPATQVPLEIVEPYVFRIARDAMPRDGAWPMGSARDRLAVPIDYILDHDAQPTISITRWGDGRDVGELVYYTCRENGELRFDRNARGRMEVESAQKASTTFELSCDNWDPWGELVVEVDYRDAYELEIALRPRALEVEAPTEAQPERRIESEGAAQAGSGLGGV